MKMGDNVVGLGKKSWLKGRIIGINDENGALAIKTKEGAICTLYKHEAEKENT